VCFRQPGLENGVDHLDDCRPQMLFSDEAPPHVQEVAIPLALLVPAHPLQPGVGPQAVEAQEQPPLNRRTIELLARCRTLELIGKVDPQVGFFVEQADHGPAQRNFSFEPGQVGRLFLWFYRRHRDPAIVFGLDLNGFVGLALQPRIEHRERVLHCRALGVDKGLFVLRQSQCLIIRRSLYSEILGQIPVRIAKFLGAFDPNFFAAEPLAQHLQDRNLVVDAVNPRVLLTPVRWAGGSTG
jgi:hypothetical protein